MVTMLTMLILLAFAAAGLAAVIATVGILALFWHAASPTIPRVRNDLLTGLVVVSGFVALLGLAAVTWLSDPHLLVQAGIAVALFGGLLSAAATLALGAHAVSPNVDLVRLAHMQSLLCMGVFLLALGCVGISSEWSGLATLIRNMQRASADPACLQWLEMCEGRGADGRVYPAACTAYRDRCSGR
jgi:hypothetical protein